MENLTNDDIKVILEIIDSVSVPVKQSREIINPIILKLQEQLNKDTAEK